MPEKRTGKKQGTTGIGDAIRKGVEFFAGGTFLGRAARDVEKGRKGEKFKTLGEQMEAAKRRRKKK